MKIYKFRAKDSETEPYPLRLSNILKVLTLDNMKNRIKRECGYFSVNYDPINTSNLLGIHRFLMKET